MSRARNLCCKSHGYPKLKEKVGDLSCREPRPCIRFKCSLVNTILDVLHQRPGWVEVKDEGDWDFYWCDANWVRESSDHTYVDEHVRISHFRNHYELTRKNYMVKNLKRFRRRVEREEGKLEARKYDFFPKTFDLPSEYHLFVEEFRKNPGTTWIMKPVARSQGRGIFLFRKLKDIMDWRKNNSRSDDRKEEAPVENYVAQRYIEDPYLIGASTTTTCTSPTWPCRRRRPPTTRTSLLSVHRVIVSDRRRFQLYGYDVLIDRRLKPWLLEVNASPSLTASSPEDYELKTCLLEDVLHVVDMEARLTGKEKRVGGFDLMWDDGPVGRGDGAWDAARGDFVANTHLGCHNDREKQLRELFRSLWHQKKA
ncbi:probable tubulin polyglutamylase TTLL9 isoform X2 [Ornithorhynchus anatinus]|uniref:probable tubulin polyglutamylase TTLL9 isoform X2 n=1 Tax=Ornithorhynchus anatinus TaxID=9258 RepID=UPI0019D4DD8F|nr:probable tubulin polyglutamylase TTLL9 isoform X2 [Ornithorhynchus anatinus]